MQTQFKCFKDCKEYELFRFNGNLYYKTPIIDYTDIYNQKDRYNAVNAETGEIGWIDGLKKVEVIA